MKNKQKWLIISIVSLLGLSYLCAAYLFYLKYSDVFNEISNYQMQDMRSGLSINKFIAISCLFIIFLIILFICIFINLLFEIENNQKKYNQIKEYISKINKGILNYKNEIININKSLVQIKKQKNKQMKNISIFIKHSEDSINTIKQVYHELRFFINKNAKFEDLNERANKLSEMANDIAINVAIENTKNKNSKQINKGLMAVSDISRRLCKKSNTIFEDVQNWNSEFLEKTENIKNETDKINNICTIQGALSKKTESEFDKISGDLDESINKMSFIIKQINDNIEKNNLECMDTIVIN